MPHTRTHALETTSLICPRCRHMDSDGQMVVFELRTDRGPARPGQLDAHPSIDCSNPHCRAAYPVFEGVPVIFAPAGATAVAQNLPLDVSAIPVQSMKAAVDAAPMEAALCAAASRVGRYAWAGFADWSDGPRPVIDTPIHAVEVMAWVRSLERSSDTLTAVLGAALGREAWETPGQSVLVDAHLPSLLAARRLAREGRLELLLPSEPGRWLAMQIEVPAGTEAPDTSWVCCDVAAPPFLAEAFPEVVATNLVDSVDSPMLAIGQSCALADSDGIVAFTCPFAFREQVTPPSAWWSTAHPKGAEAAMRLQLSQVAPNLHVMARREFVWSLWGGARELSVYRSVGLALAAPDA